MSTNTIALVTGVSSGIGRATAQLLVEHGARVFGAVRVLRRTNRIGKVELVRMDVTDDLFGDQAAGETAFGEKLRPNAEPTNQSGHRSKENPSPSLRTKTVIAKYDTGDQAASADNSGDHSR